MLGVIFDQIYLPKSYDDEDHFIKKKATQYPSKIKACDRCISFDDKRDLNALEWRSFYLGLEIHLNDEPI